MGEGFTKDTRDICGTTPVGDLKPIEKTDGILCLSPEKTTCERFERQTQFCFTDGKTHCIDWHVVCYSILLMNALQILFESMLLTSLETSEKPTYLDKMHDPEM